MPNGYNIAINYWIKAFLLTMMAFYCQIALADINPSVIATLNRSNPLPQVHPTTRIPDLIEAANTLSGSPQKMALIDLNVTMRKIKAEERQKVLNSISALLSRNEIPVRLATATLLKAWSAELSPIVRKRLISSMNSIASNGSPNEIANAKMILSVFGESSISDSPGNSIQDRSPEIQSSNKTAHTPLSGQAWLDLFSDELTELRKVDKATAERIMSLALSGQQSKAQTLLEGRNVKNPQQKDDIKSWVKTFERESKSWPEVYAKEKKEILNAFKAKNLDRALAIFHTVKIQIADFTNWKKTNSKQLEALEINWESEIFDILSTSSAIDQKYASAMLKALSSIESTRLEHIDFLRSHAADLNTLEAIANANVIELKKPRIGQTLLQLEARFSELPPTIFQVEPKDHKSQGHPVPDIKLTKRLAVVFQVGLCAIFIMFIFESIVRTSPGKTCFGLFNNGLNSPAGTSPGLTIRFFIKYSWLITWVLIKTVDSMNEKGKGLVFGEQSLILETPIFFFLLYSLISLITLIVNGKFLHDILGGTAVESSIDSPITEPSIPMGFGTRIESSKIKKNQGWDEEDERELAEKPAKGPFELRYDDGTLETVGYLSGGNLDGEIKYYNPDGRISRISYYADGKLHGLTTTFDHNEKAILYECYVDGNLFIAHSRGTLEFWLSKKTTCLEFRIARRLTALILDYNLCLFSAGSAKFFEINLPVIYGIFFLIPIIPELVLGISFGKSILRISNPVNVLQTKGRALRARWFVKHYPFWLLIVLSFIFQFGSIPATITESLETVMVLKVIGLLILGFIVINYFCLKSTGVFFHTLVSNPEVATSEQDEKIRITDLIQTGYFIDNRIILLRLMAVALDLMLIQFILGYMI